MREEDLTMRQGLAGFFARGHNPPPDGVEVLLELPGGEPIVHRPWKRSRHATRLVAVAT